MIQPYGAINSPPASTGNLHLLFSLFPTHLHEEHGEPHTHTSKFANKLLCLHATRFLHLLCTFEQTQCQ